MQAFSLNKENSKHIPHLYRWIYKHGPVLCLSSGDARMNQSRIDLISQDVRFWNLGGKRSSLPYPKAK